MVFLYGIFHPRKDIFLPFWSLLLNWSMARTSKSSGMLNGLPSISYMLEIFSHISLILPWYFSSWSLDLLCYFVMVLLLWVIWMMPIIHLPTFGSSLFTLFIFRTLTKIWVAFLISTAGRQSQSHLCHIPGPQQESSCDSSRGIADMFGWEFLKQKLIPL